MRSVRLIKEEIRLYHLSGLSWSDAADLVCKPLRMPPDRIEQVRRFLEAEHDELAQKPHNIDPDISL